ncbi:transcription and mRNA export factor ENY2 isoform X2 [Corythoichthys intestinalis]|uniref:transcription and mRNA export factor ENY2 isoform X2 n=1 Tax=Corythoichthys intestinalis TaxID=161448 RepID=UPI0025A5A84B|nr:transcription and mRNA export factor ENY2 isoform X2 [Corythoichthys intestinalis]
MQSIMEASFLFVFSVIMLFTALKMVEMRQRINTLLVLRQLKWGRNEIVTRQCFRRGDYKRETARIISARKGMNKDSQMRAAINQKLIEMGEREKLKELLKTKLVECGWKDQLKALCKDVIREKGLDHVTVEDLVTEITPKGRGVAVHQR